MSQAAHGYPEAIPSTNVLLFANATRVENQFRVKVEALNTSTSDWKVILENAEFPKYIDSGHLLFRQDEVNLIAPFDPVLLELTGPAVALTDEMRGSGVEANGQVSQLAISRGGTLAYAPSVPTLREVYVGNRDGSSEPLGIRLEMYRNLSVSADGQYVALSVRREFEDEDETRLYNFSRETTTRLSQDSDAYSSWHPDSQAMVVLSRGLWLKQLNGNQRLLAELEGGGYILRNGSWHPDGRQFAVTRQSGSKHDILLLTVDEEITVEPLLEGTSSYHSPRFLPDGQWLAYVSDKSGQRQVYIRRFPDGEEFIVSNGPLWSADGTELFFVQMKEGQSYIDTKMSAVTFTETENRTQISQHLDLFPMFTRSQTGAVDDYSSSNNTGQRYGLLSDGRFLMLNGPSGTLQNEIVLVQNWFEELKRLAPLDPQ